MPNVTDEIFSKFLSLAKTSGIDLGISPEGSAAPDEKPVIPAVNLNRSVSELAHETGLNLKDSGLYVFANRLVTVSEEGLPEDMDDLRFRSWVDQFQFNYYKRRPTDGADPGAPIKATLKADVAKCLLRSDEFLCHVPIIKRILPVRLPAWKTGADGEKKIELLPYGYDQETQCFTRNTGIDYHDFPLVRAIDFLSGTVRDFPFGDDGRSLSVQISAMLTVFCQLLFAPRDRLPMIYFNANQPGSGKSRLAEMCIYPIYGSADALTYSDNDEFVKKLDSWAQTGIAYTFLDDVSGLVRNNDLNRWITSPTWAGRLMHRQSMFSCANQSLTLLTGNQATLSEDLTRRCLMVDLWSSELPDERQTKFSHVIDAEWLAASPNRANILSALWGLVKNWAANDFPQYHQSHPGFENWSRLIPAITTLAGYSCPLQKPNVQDAGGKQEVEFTRLLEIAVRDYNPQIGAPCHILLTDWCRLARCAGVFHSVVSDIATMREVLDANPKLYKPVKDDDGTERQLREPDKDLQAQRYMDKSQSTKFGNLLNKYYRGQIRTINGRRYKFADREARHSTFTLELIKD